MTLVDKVSPIHQPNPELFTMLLDCLNQIGRVDIKLLRRTFLIRLLSLVGFRPYIDGCLSCMDRKITRAWFSNREGGLLCERCHSRDPASVRISPAVVRAMRMIESLPLSRALLVKLPEKDEETLRDVVEKFIRYHVSS